MGYMENAANPDESVWSTVKMTLEENMTNASMILELTWLMLVILLSCIGNVMVLYVILFHLKLHTITNQLILALSVCDLLTAVVCMPLAIGTVIKDTWMGNDALCVAHGVLTSTLGLQATYMLTCITVERCYSVVVLPKSGTKIRFTWVLIGMGFFLALVFSLPWSLIQIPLVTDEGSQGAAYYKDGFRHCMYAFHGATSPNGTAFTLLYVILCYFCPTVLMLCSSVLLWRMIYHNHCRIQPASSQPRQLRFSGEIRTATTVITMVLLFLLTKGPYFMMGIICAIGGHPLSPAIDTAGLWLYWASCAVNPIIYAVRNPNVRIILNIRRASLGGLRSADRSQHPAPCHAQQYVIPTISGLKEEDVHIPVVEIDNVDISNFDHGDRSDSIPSVLFYIDRYNPRKGSTHSALSSSTTTTM